MYTFDSRVRYSEINYQKGVLDISSIINYFQDCSTFQSKDLNIGLDYLQSRNRAWILNSWQVQFNKAIPLGEYITIGTWPYGFKGCYGYRNFIIKNKNDEVLVAANSIWVYMDTLTGRPTKATEENTGYKLEPAYPMEYADRKIALPKDLNSLPTFPVIKSNIDSYNHVNNGQYIKMAEEFLPEEYKVTSMRVEYKKQAVLGDIILPMTALEESRYVVALCNVDENPYAIIEFNR
ncbi:MAG: acyl-[acyl-carrier-protein] thioesterase [Clostridiales bacterium]|nr:acyl-[acyl-carrier-protein] thioesterase [Clostridiales bacterium]